MGWLGPFRAVPVVKPAAEYRAHEPDQGFGVVLGYEVDASLWLGQLLANSRIHRAQTTSCQLTFGG